MRDIIETAIIPFILTVGVCFVIFILLTTHHHRVIKMAELGYCEVAMPGATNTIWTKCK